MWHSPKYSDHIIPNKSLPTPADLPPPPSRAVLGPGMTILQYVMFMIFEFNGSMANLPGDDRSLCCWFQAVSPAAGKDWGHAFLFLACLFCFRSNVGICGTKREVLLPFSHCCILLANFDCEV